jgi:hypothetical protein
MYYDVVRYRHPLQSHAFVSGLASGLALAPLAFRIQSASRPIAGRRFIAIAAVGV